ncbi:YafY family protein [Fluviicola sp.]|uniref:helix-turn-helix transcriptional regulator n=1 Tax=Fluviicola sp. TaxID=1917219 RepID=UPI0031CDE24D
MNSTDIPRIARITAILIQLQTKSVVTSTMLAEKCGVSVRTIYRDLKTLEMAGIPIVTVDGKGYSLLEGFKIPPVMFNEDEANALITMEQLVRTNKDSSLVEAYLGAVSKVKAVLSYAAKDRADLLSNRIAVSPVIPKTNSSDSLTVIQNALTNFKVLKITYRSEKDPEQTERTIEPFAMYYTLDESWALIAFCRLRKDYRMFRLDRIQEITPQNESFSPHPITLHQYLAERRKKFQHP